MLPILEKYTFQKLIMRMLQLKLERKAYQMIFISNRIFFGGEFGKSKKERQYFPSCWLLDTLLWVSLLPD